MSKADEFLYKPSLEAYIEFYNKLPKISQFKSDSPLFKDNKDYQNLSLIKSKSSPALCHVEKFIDHIVLDKKYYTFYFYNPMFWMIPVESISGKIIGFLLKGFTGKNYNWIHYSKISLLFGFYDFVDYKKNEPIIITEGWRDVLYIKQFYKYVLSLNTSSLNKGTLEVLKHMTNKIILVLDNDVTGKKMAVINRTMCTESDIASVILQPALKDMGEYFFNDIFKDKFELDLEYAFDVLKGSNSDNQILLS